MRILYILGNGFDLSMGLDTSYKSFLNHYCSNHSPNPSNIIKEFQGEIWQNIDTWANLEEHLGQWLDDKMYEDKAVCVYDDLIKELTLYMSQEQERLSFESKIQDTIKDCLINPQNSLSRVEDQASIETFIKQHNTTANVVNTITLNYTDTFERLLFPHSDESNRIKYGPKPFTIEKPIHLHGTVDGGMVLGVNDANQIANKKLLDDIRVKNRFIKPIALTNVHRNGFEKKAKDVITEAELICIYGTSFGKTDQRIWSKVMERAINNKCRVILFHYGKDVFIGNQRYQEVDYINEANQKFVSTCGNKNGGPLSIPNTIMGEYNSPIFNLGAKVNPK